MQLKTSFRLAELNQLSELCFQLRLHIEIFMLRWRPHVDAWCNGLRYERTLKSTNL